MHKAPRGFNELFAAARAELVADLLGRHVLPVFCLDNSDAPSFEGSGVALRISGDHFLVSAAHVLDPTTRGGVHLLLNGREQNPLENPTWLTVSNSPGLRHDDLVDLGYIRLTAAEVNAIGSQNFLEVLASERPPVAADWSFRNILFGFPANRQLRDDIGMKYDLMQTYFTSPELALGKYAMAGLDRERHFWHAVRPQ